MKGFWQWLRIAAISVFLLLLVWVGVLGGIDGFVRAQTVSQRLVFSAQFGYGLASAAVLWATWRNEWWLELSLYLWGVILVVAGILTQMVLAGANWMTGAFTGIVVVFVALLIGHGCEAHARWSKVRKLPLIPYY